MASDYQGIRVQVRDVDGESFAMGTNRIVVPSASGVNTGDDKILYDAHPFLDGDLVLYEGGTADIGGLTDGNYYYVRDKETNAFKLADTLGGSAKNLSSTGTGDQTFIEAVEVKVRVDGQSADVAESPLKTNADGEIGDGTFSAVAVGAKVNFRIENRRGRAFSFAQITTA